jgi:triose/dihydroxyacetone kinase / FAD-AMP lyase (cyclizing)
MVSGTFVSSLDMVGVSISVMHVTDHICKLLAAPTHAPAWPRCFSVPQTKPLEPLSARSSMAAQAAIESTRSKIHGTSDESHLLIRVLSHCAHACIAAEPELTHQDKLTGDGDCGHTIKQGAEGIMATLTGLRVDDLGSAGLQLASSVGKTMGGTSGALYSLFFTAASVPLKGIQADAATPAIWAAALTSGVNVIKKYGKARIGDRSMVDALEPAAIAATESAGARAAAAHDLEVCRNRCPSMHLRSWYVLMAT